MRDLEFSGEDIVVKDGDFVVGGSRQQHTALLLASSPGHWRQSPLAGVGIERYINAPHTELHRNAMAQVIRKQMDADGLRPGIIDIDNDFNITID